MTKEKPVVMNPPKWYRPGMEDEEDGHEFQIGGNERSVSPRGVVMQTDLLVSATNCATESGLNCKHSTDIAAEAIRVLDDWGGNLVVGACRDSHRRNNLEKSARRKLKEVMKERRAAGVGMFPMIPFLTWWSIGSIIIQIVRFWISLRKEAE